MWSIGNWGDCPCIWRGLLALGKVTPDDLQSGQWPDMTLLEGLGYSMLFHKKSAQASSLSLGPTLKRNFMPSLATVPWFQGHPSEQIYHVIRMWRWWCWLHGYIWNHSAKYLVISVCPLETLVRFISPNLIHYNSITSTSGSSSSWQITLQLLASTRSGPDTIGFNAGISGVAIAAAWRQVAELLTVMKGCGIQQAGGDWRVGWRLNQI